MVEYLVAHGHQDAMEYTPATVIAFFATAMRREAKHQESVLKAEAIVYRNAIASILNDKPEPAFEKWLTS